jgi:cytochrome c oxidase subunit 2
VLEGRTRGRLLLTLSAALSATLIAAPAAHAGLLFPESGGSPNADSIKTLYVMVFVLGRRSTATRSSRSAGRSARP